MTWGHGFDPRSAQYGPPPYWFGPPIREPDITDKIKELEAIEEYRKRLRKEIKEESSGDKKEHPKKWHEKVTLFQAVLLALVAWPITTIIMINSHALALSVIRNSIR